MMCVRCAESQHLCLTAMAIRLTFADGLMKMTAPRQMGRCGTARAMRRYLRNRIDGIPLFHYPESMVAPFM